MRPAIAHTRRRGHTLLELVVVISIGVVMLGMGIATINLLLAADREQHRAVRTSLELSRLSRQFRDDVHAAHAAELTGERALELSLPAAEGSTIAYTIDGPVVTRVATDPEEPPAHEMFRFPPGVVLSFARDASVLRLSVGLPANHKSRPEATSSGSRIVEIEAALGSQRQLAGVSP